MNETWYTSSKREDNQGLIYSEKSGRDIAVSYNPEDAPLIAAAPELLRQLENTITALENVWNKENIPPALLRVTIDEARAAIQNATR